MFNFEETFYMSYELLGIKGLSMEAKFLFSELDEIQYKTKNNVVEYNNKKAMELTRIKSTSTLSKVKKELIDNDLAEVEVRKNKVYYTLKKTFLKEA
ncbi:hypothetical protein [Romboutsia sp.]|uniref:hypothetical protein n=1 Tax=Romboutsia sp. TaxID=1965302 RepID=UPI002B7058C8|nr:hypothetical protein [Romboutsia sp.]HSQ90166.1 hypothetical protein [Romboutsia sp.]